MHGQQNFKICSTVIKFDETCRPNGFLSVLIWNLVYKKNTEKNEEKSAYVESFSRHTVASIQSTQWHVG